MDGIDSGQATRTGGLPASALAIMHRVWDPAIAIATALLHDKTILTADLPTLTRAVHAAIEGTGELAAAVSTELAAMEARVQALDVRLSVVEQKGFAYCGVWKVGQIYGMGSWVTDHGALWHANRRTDRRPGEGDSGWILAVKAGRDRRDAKNA